MEPVAPRAQPQRPPVVSRALSPGWTSADIRRRSRLAQAGLPRWALRLPDDYVQPKALGARLRAFSRVWSTLTSDRWILETISGHCIDFLSPPRQERPPPDFHCDREKARLVDVECEEMVRKGAIVPIPAAEARFVSRLLVTPKKDGSLRPCVDLRQLNTFVPYEHFKMEDMHLVRELLRPGDWMVKLDLKDAYFHVPIAEDYQPLLCFRWAGQMFMFQCLPFGLAAAPRIFTKLLKPVCATLRALGIRLVLKLDDMLIMASSASECLENLTTAVHLLAILGFTVNWRKSVLTPTQIMEFLGFDVSSSNMQLSLPADKVAKLLKSCRNTLASERLTVRSVASLIGQMQSTMLAVLPAPLHYRNLQRLVIVGLADGGSYETAVSLSPRARSDIEWWLEHLHRWNGRSVVQPLANLCIQSDASLSGWGAACKGQSTGGVWSMDEGVHHINWLELKAAWLALRVFTRGHEAPQVLLQLDNRSAVAYINRFGGTHSSDLSDLACRLWDWCLSRDVSLHAEHLPGTANTIADAESRRQADSGDWRLAPTVFQQVCSAFGRPTIDLFASRLNAHVRRFYSWRPDPDAVATDALAMAWNSERGYAFPPFSLIGRTLAKVRQEKVARLVLITPLWRGQSWFADLLEMSAAAPCLLPWQPDLLTDPVGTPHPLVERRTLQLVAWSISGELSRCRAFRQTLSHSSRRHGGNPRSARTLQHGASGPAGVTSGVWIPLHPL